MAKERVLVADDDPAIRRLTTMALAHGGFDVVEAASGEEALACCAETSFALIMLDNVMPGMRGTEVARALRTQPLSANTPIVILSGLDDDDAQWEGWRAGIDLYITKPIDEDVLIAQVSGVLTRAS